jgi:alpha,alpha-trehalase
VAAAGPHPLLDDAVRFVTERILADGPGLKPAYCVDGEPVPSERSLPRLAGYPGGFDKVGNHVNRQFQLDIFGEALLLFAAAARHDRLAGEHWRAVEATVAAIAARGSEPDAGVWELHDDRWAHSRLMCVAGLRAMAAQAPASEAARWSRLAGHPRRRRRLRPPQRTLATGAKRPAGRRRPAGAGDPGRSAG